MLKPKTRSAVDRNRNERFIGQSRDCDCRGESIFRQGVVGGVAKAPDKCEEKVFSIINFINHLSNTESKKRQGNWFIKKIRVFNASHRIENFSWL